MIVASTQFKDVVTAAVATQIEQNAGFWVLKKEIFQGKRQCAKKYCWRKELYDFYR